MGTTKGFSAEKTAWVGKSMNYDVHQLQVIIPTLALIVWYKHIMTFLESPKLYNGSNNIFSRVIAPLEKHTWHTHPRITTEKVPIKMVKAVTAAVLW